MFSSIIDGIQNGKIACDQSMKDTHKKVGFARNNLKELLELEKKIIPLLKATKEIEIEKKTH